MKYIPYTVTKGVATKEITCITGKGKPTSATEGAVGLLYMDEDNGAVYKCVAAQDGVYTWEIMGGGVETNVLYYATLSAAIADINAGTTENATGKANANAKVEVFYSENGGLLVKLLDDVAEGGVIAINKSLDLVLNGKTLAFNSSAAGMTFAEGVECTIDGQVEGSRFSCSEVVKSDASYIFATVNGKALKLHGGNYTFSGDVYNSALFFKVEPTCELFEVVGVEFHMENSQEKQATTAGVKAMQVKAQRSLVKDCKFTSTADRCNNLFFVSGHAIVENVSVVETANTMAYGIYARGGSVQVSNCEVSTTASNGTAYSFYVEKSDVLESVVANNSKFSAGGVGTCYGFRCGGGNVRITDCELLGAEYALCVYPDAKAVCVDRCALAGYVNTIRAAASGATEVFITDTTLSGGYCAETHKEFTKNRTPGAALYVGGDASSFGANNIYVDGCTFNTQVTTEGETAESPIYVPCVQIASGMGEYANCVRMSNASVNGDGTISIEAVAEGKAAHHLDVGIGTNITAEMIDNADCATFTDELYRKKHPDAELNGADFTALVNYMNAKTAGV